jgi:hypothetical protein
MRLLDLLTLTCLLVYELLPASGEVLNLELLNTVLGHLSLHIFAFHLALLAMLFKYGTIHQN